MKPNNHPVLVRIISYCFLIGIPVTFIIALIAMIKSPETFANFSTFEMFISFTVMALNFTGGIYLFKLKSQAFYIFITSLILSYLPAAIRLFSEETSNYLLDFKLSSIFSFIIWLMFLFYLWWLKKSKVLI